MRVVLSRNEGDSYEHCRRTSPSSNDSTHCSDPTTSTTSTYSAGPTWSTTAWRPAAPRGLPAPEFLREASSTFGTDGWHELVVVADGDYVVQFSAHGGHWSGEAFLGHKTAAGDYLRDFACMYRITGGRIAERWAVRDDLTMLRQLGALT